MRAVVLWLYDGICYIDRCRLPASNVHHCDRINTNNSLLNLVPLCEVCHKMVHRSDAYFKVQPKQIIVLLLRKISEFSRLR